MSPAQEEHSPRHEEELIAILAASDDAEGARAALAASPQRDCARCREEVEQLLAIHDRLTEGAADARDTVDHAPPVAGGAGDAALDSFLEARLAEARGPRLLRRIAVTLAAASVITFVVYLQSGSEPSPSEGITMGTASDVTLEHPVGEVPSWGTFRWSGELPPGGWFALRVWAGDETLVDEAALTQAHWSPKEGDAQAWPARIEWELTVYDASGKARESRSTEASLSSR